MHKYKKLELPQFECDIHIFKSLKRDEIDKYIADLEKNNDEIEKIEYDLDSSIGFAFKVGADFFIVLNTNRIDIKVHEIYHTISSIYAHIGMPQNKDTDEF